MPLPPCGACADQVLAQVLRAGSSARRSRRRNRAVERESIQGPAIRCYSRPGGSQAGWGHLPRCGLVVIPTVGTSPKALWQLTETVNRVTLPPPAPALACRRKRGRRGRPLPPSRCGLTCAWHAPPLGAVRACWAILVRKSVAVVVMVIAVDAQRLASMSYRLGSRLCHRNRQFP